jgi:hypothetical protein
MNKWNKIALKASDATVEEMTTADGIHYYSQSMLDENLASLSANIRDGRSLYSNNKDINTFENGTLHLNDATKKINLDSLIITGDKDSDNGMFAHSSITSFVGDLPKLSNGTSMFNGSDIESFISYTPKLKDGTSMFKDCTNFTEFLGNLSSVTVGDYMFENCPNIKFNDIDLSSLENGENMFYGCNIGGNDITSIIKTFGDSDTHLNVNHTPRIDITVTPEGLKAFYNETGFLSFESFAHEYNGKIFYIHFPENTMNWGSLDFKGNIYYSDVDGNITSMNWDNDFFETVEDISGLEVGSTGEFSVFSDYSGDLESVKYARGTFYKNTELTSFKPQLPNVKDIDYIFYGCTNLTEYNGNLSKCESMLDAFYGCSKLTSFSANLSNLKNGYYAFYNCNNLANINIQSLDNLEIGSRMFYYTKLPSWKYDMPKLKNGSNMFYNVPMTHFKGDLSSLENGEGMFIHSDLTEFSSNLNSLKYGESMFQYASLPSFKCNLPLLENGYYMFQASDLTEFEGDMPRLKNADYMFNGCTALTSFNSKLGALETARHAFRGAIITQFDGDLSTLKGGDYMFESCTKLTSCLVDLSSLEEGLYMFLGCKLDGPSIKRIYDTLPIIDRNHFNYRYTTNYGRLDIGINSTYSSTASTNKTRLNNFAVSAGFTDWATMKQAFKDKGWSVTWYYAGSTDTSINV